MKVQTGVRVEAEVWAAYRALCGRERLRPSLPMEEFLRFVLESDSAMGAMSVMKVAVKARSEGVEAYVRVLLDWFEHGKYFVYGEGGDNVSIEWLLLNALKLVVDSGLRRQIEEALIANQRQRFEKGKS